MDKAPIVLILLPCAGFFFVSLVGNSEAIIQRIIKYLSSLSLVCIVSIVIMTTSYLSSDVFKSVIFSMYSVTLASVISTYFAHISSKIIIASIATTASLFILPIIEGTHSYALVNFADPIAWGRSYHISVLLTSICFIIVLLSVSVGYFVSKIFKTKKIFHSFETQINIEKFSNKFAFVIAILVIAMFMQDFKGYSHYGNEYSKGTVLFWIIMIISYTYLWLLSKIGIKANWLILLGISILATSIFFFHLLFSARYILEKGGWLFFIIIIFMYYISALANTERNSSE